jgi:3',5'-cyclic AMP phosphodiesterase CpdA
MTWILHLSDPHLGEVSEDLDDDKAIFDGQPDLETTQTVFRRTLGKLDRFVTEHGRPQLALISGDLTVACNQSGFDEFKKLLVERAGILPDERERIVVVPGNHDVAWGQPPASEARYAAFNEATRAQNCTTPLLDGLDFDKKNGALTPLAGKHRHLAWTDEVLVVPINSSNFCGITVTPRKGWTEADWKKALAPIAGDGQILHQLNKLIQHDVARISRPQILALGHELEQAGIPPADDDPRLRVAVLHHQLLPLSTREERKPFEGLVSLGLLRQFLREQGIHLVVHGHKHESALYWHTIGSADSNLAVPQHCCLVISSPGRFDVGIPTIRAIMLEGTLLARNLRVVTIAGSSPAQRKPHVIDDQTVGIWKASMWGESRPEIEISAANSHTAYARIRALFGLDGRESREGLLVRIDGPDGAERLPPDYPSVPGGNAWLTQLVDWWQKDRSELVARGLAEFNHGERIRRRWGSQVRRAIDMLNARADSSRAMLELVSPKETGRYLGDHRDLNDGSYPALVLVQFAIAERGGMRRLDCFAYFRKQEMQYWWTVNVAELAQLQREVCAGLDESTELGEVATFAAVAHWGQALPRVAVPLLDMLVEDEQWLWRLALAVADPATADAQVREEWGRLLEDLQGAGRAEPPRPKDGASMLLEHLGRLRSLKPSEHIEAVYGMLQALLEEYEVLDGVPRLNTAGQKKLARLVENLHQAVHKALGGAGS